MQPILDALNKINGVEALAYIDDITIMADSQEAALKAHEVMVTMCGAINLKVNAKKCVLFTNIPRDKLDKAFLDFELALLSTEENAPSPCMRVLGAWIGRNDDDERIALTKNTLNGKHDFETFFRRLSMATGAWASSVLASCGLSKLNFALRTHSPVVTSEIAEHFDAETDFLISNWLDFDAAAAVNTPTNDHEVMRALQHLPISMGGLGFTRLTAVAKAAFESSVDSLTADGVRSRLARSAAQRAHTRPVHERFAEFVDNAGPFFKLHRALNMMSGSGTAVRDPTFRSTDQAWRLLLAHRANAQINGMRDHLNGAGVVCPGCKKNYTNWHSFIGHAPHCARVPGYNVSAGHALIKEELKSIFYDCGVQCDSQEPRDVRFVSACPGCGGTDITEHGWEQHRDSCAGCNRHTPTPRGSGPDIRIRIGEDKLSSCALNFTPLGCCIDVTQVSSRCSSNKDKDLKQIFAEREDQKVKKYRDKLHSAQQELMIFAVNEDGQLNKDAEKILYYCSSKPRAPPYEQLRRRMQQAALRAMGNALVNVMRQLKLNSSAIFNTHPVSPEARRSRICSELSIIRNNLKINAENMRKHFANPIGPEASKIILARTITELQDHHRRARDSELQLAAAQAPENSAAPPKPVELDPDREKFLSLDAAHASSETLIQWTHRLAAVHKLSFFSAEQSTQFARNAQSIAQAETFARANRARERALVASNPVLFLTEDEQSPVRTIVRRTATDENNVLHLLSFKTNKTGVLSALINFLNSNFEPTSLQYAIHNFFQYVTNNAGKLLPERDEHFSRNHFYNIFNSYQEKMFKDAEQDPVLLALESYNDCADDAEKDTLRSLTRIILYTLGYLSNDGRITPSNRVAPAQNLVQLLSQQNQQQLAVQTTNIAHVFGRNAVSTRQQSR